MQPPTLRLANVSQVLDKVCRFSKWIEITDVERERTALPSKKNKNNKSKQYSHFAKNRDTNVKQGGL